MEVKFSNFKGFGGEHSLEIAPLTLVFGENSAGKSSLLELQRRYWDTPSTNPLKAESESGLSLANKHKRSKKIMMRRSGMTFSQHLTETLTIAIETEWVYEARSRFPAASNDNFNPHRIRYETSEGSFSGKAEPIDKNVFQFLLNRVEVRRVVESALRNWKMDQESPDIFNPNSDFWDLLTNPHETGFKPLPGPLSPGEMLAMVLPALRSTSTKIHVGPTWLRVQGDDFDNQVGAVLEWLLGALFELPVHAQVDARRERTPQERTRWSPQDSKPSNLGEKFYSIHIPAIRPELPAWFRVDREAPSPTFDPTKPELYLNWILGSGGYGPDFDKKGDPLHRRRFGDRIPDKDGVRAVNAGFERLEIPHRLHVKVDDSAPLQRAKIYLEDLRSGVKAEPIAVGSGIAQVLPIVAAVELLGPRALLSVEQPELHLHPRLQANLGEYLCDRATASSEPIIVETHSELLVLRVLRMIREGRTDPSKVAVYYVGDTSEGPQITRMRIDANGEFIDEWPTGFFEERLDELF